MSRDYWDRMFDDEDLSTGSSDSCVDCETKSGLVTSLCPVHKWVDDEDEMVTLCDECYEKRVKMAEELLKNKS